MIRIIMKPLISTIPLVGGLQVFFLNNPDIDFNLIGVADVLDMPGLRYTTCNCYFRVLMFAFSAICYVKLSWSK